MCAVTGKEKGIATITIRSNSNTNITKTVSVEVTEISITPTCSEWSKSSAIKIFTNSDTKNCKIYNKSSCTTGEECVVCEATGKYRPFYQQDGMWKYEPAAEYTSADSAKNACKNYLKDKDDVDANTCDARQIYNKVTYTRNCD